MKIAIMQPYFFPYIGYFQMVNAVDKFVFYDDVNFIKRGWINRNKILANNQTSYITISLNGSSQNKLIKDITIINKGINKIIKTIKQFYSKAPFFKDVFQIISEYLGEIDNGNSISSVSARSVQIVAEYLNIETTFEFSSVLYSSTKGMDKAYRLIEICKINNADIYINPIGGQQLYSKDYFKKYGISLYFINSKKIEYRQYNNSFISNLSIIDVLMFNPKDKIKEMLNMYKLI